MAEKKTSTPEPDEVDHRDTPRSVNARLWAEVEEKDRVEAAERAGFLLMRGLPPEDALHEALETMFAELDDMQSRGREPVSWVVFRAVAGLYPLPRRRPDGRYMRRILAAAEAVHMNALKRLDGIFGPMEKAISLRDILRERNDEQEAEIRLKLRAISRRYMDEVRQLRTIAAEAAEN